MGFCSFVCSMLKTLYMINIKVLCCKKKKVILKRKKEINFIEWIENDCIYKIYGSIIYQKRILILK